MGSKSKKSKRKLKEKKIARERKKVKDDASLLEEEKKALNQLKNTVSNLKKMQKRKEKLIEIKDSVTNTSKRADSSTKKEKMDKTKETIKNGVTSIGGYLKNGLEIGFSEAFQIEEYKKQMDAATGSSEVAGEKMAAAIKFANDTPFETGAIVDAAVKLEEMQMNSAEWMPGIADMAASTSGDIGEAYEAVADATSGNFEKMSEYGIEKGDFMAKAQEKYGEATVFDARGNVKDQVKLQELLISEMNSIYAGGTDDLEGTIAGMWSTMKGMGKSALMAIVGMQEDGSVRQGSLFEKSQELLDVLREKLAMVKGLLEKWQADGTIQEIGEQIVDAAVTIMNMFEKIFIFVVEHRETIIKLVAAFITIAAIINILITIASIIETITFLMGIFNAVSLANPLTWIVLGIIVAIFALIAVGYMLWKHWDEIIAFIATAFEGLKGIFFAVVDSLRNTFAAFINNIINGINKVIRLAKKIGIDIPEVPLIEMKTKSEDSKIQTIRSDMTDLPVQKSELMQKRSKLSGMKIPNLQKTEEGTLNKSSMPSVIVGSDYSAYIPPNKTASGVANTSLTKEVTQSNQRTSSSTKKEVKVEVHVQGNVYGEKDLLDRIGNAISQKLVLALDNM